jgi:CHAT domain-containing protein
VDVSSETITALADQFRHAILNGNGDESARLGRALHRLLLEPVDPDISGAKFLLISPDKRLADVPFAALNDSQGRFVCEDHAIVIAASSSVYMRGLQKSSSTASDRVLIVGDPAFDRRAFPQLAALPAAGIEARGIAGLYPRSTLWTGPDATAERVKAALELNDFMHFATHALVNDRDPSRSSLVLAPSNANSGLLYVYEIMNLKLHASLVTLTGCRTAVNGEAHGSVRSLALAFVAAGARNVLGTLWNIDDNSARYASLAFHRAVQAGLSPAEALQRTQAALLRSPDPIQRDYKNWAAFQIYGTGF